MNAAQKYQVPFFYTILLIVVVLTGLIFLPYFQALFLALVFAVVMSPLYRFFRRLLIGWNDGAATLSVATIFFLVVVPLGFLTFLVFEESRDLYTYFSEGEGTLTLIDYAGRLQIFLSKYLPNGYVPEITFDQFQGFIDRIYVWATDNFGGFFNNVMILVGNAFIFVLALYFFLRDGKRFTDIIIKMSPLQNSYDEKILKRMSIAINSVITGSLLVALFQGLLAGIGFWIFGQPSPIIWGSLAVIASLIPSVGTFIVTIPAVIMVLLVQGPWPAVGLMFWGVFVVGLADNFLRPFVLEKGIKIHPFLILLSVFGGISMFGALGFLIGPIILSLLFTLIDVHADVISMKAPQDPIPEETIS